MPPKMDLWKKSIKCFPEPNTPPLLEKAIIMVFELNCLHMNGGRGESNLYSLDYKY